MDWRRFLSAVRATVPPTAAELSEAERVVMQAEIERLRAAIATTERAAAGERRELLELTRHAAEQVDAAMDAVRLPLQILLDSRFGELNENQEELIGAARVAADDARAEARDVVDLLRLETGDVTLRRDRIAPSELMRGLTPVLTAVARREGVPLSISTDPVLPAVVGDASRLTSALRDTSVLAINAGVAGVDVRVTATAQAVQWSIAPAFALSGLLRRRWRTLGVAVAHTAESVTFSVPRYDDAALANDEP
jgi:signal transduction histidine kinase